jgi:hypothetical protein
MKIIIKKITLILSGGPDEALIYVDLPPTMWPYDNDPVFRLDLAYDTGFKYCSENFPNVPFELINTR